MSFLLALINDHRVSAGDKIADIIGPGPKQLRHAGSLRQNEHACILDGRGLGHCWVIVVYVLGSGATLGLADARGYRCRNKGNVVVRCGDYRPVPRDPPNHKEALKPSRGILKEVRGDAHHRKERRVLLGRPKDGPGPRQGREGSTKARKSWLRPGSLEHTRSYARSPVPLRSRAHAPPEGRRDLTTWWIYVSRMCVPVDWPFGSIRH